jgi:hypothetical protein
MTGHSQYRPSGRIGDGDKTDRAGGYLDVDMETLEPW